MVHGDDMWITASLSFGDLPRPSCQRQRHHHHHRSDTFVVWHVCIVSHSDPQSFITSLDLPGTSESVEMSPTLLEAQTSALLSLLNLNEQQPSTSSNAGTRPQTPSNNNNNDHAGGASNDLLAFEKGKNGPLVWKVLILDDQSKDVLATSLRVQDLREQGVTLHM
jgi:hypothetical protein